MKAVLGDIGLLILRMFGGLTMLTHGWGKLSAFSDKMDVFPDPLGLGSSLSLGLAIGAEFGCAILLVLGIFTRLASIPLIITMAVAFMLIHGSDPFSVKELAFLYLGIYVSLFFTGGGKFVAVKGKHWWAQ